MKTSLTDSSVKTFLMVLASIGAILSVFILDRGSSSFKGSVLVTTTSFRGEFSIFRYASPEN
jgi:hypothetical protein